MSKNGAGQPEKPRPRKQARKKVVKKETNKKTARKVGRPKIYSDKMAQAFLDRWMNDETIRGICSDPKMPSAPTVFQWIADNEGKTEKTPGFSERYARAREVKCLLILDEIEELTEKAFLNANGRPGTGEAGAKVQAIKLKIDTLKWKLSKILPECSEKVRQELTGKDGGPIRQESDFTVTPEDEAVIARIREKRDAIQQS